MRTDKTVRSCGNGAYNENFGLDSSGLVASVATVCDDNMLGEYTVNYKKTHSQTLQAMLDEVAKMIELDLNSIDAIAIAGGPGSFTGALDWSGNGKRDLDWH